MCLIKKKLEYIVCKMLILLSTDHWVKPVPVIDDFIFESKIG